jgi:hypothetical protein
MSGFVVMHIAQLAGEHVRLNTLQREHVKYCSEVPMQGRRVESTYGDAKYL